MSATPSFTEAPPTWFSNSDRSSLAESLSVLSWRLQNNAFPITTSKLGSEVTLDVLQKLMSELVSLPFINSMLPPELFGKCMDEICKCDPTSSRWFLKDHKKCIKTWISASLVCKSWSIEGQRNLFRAVDITSVSALKSFVINSPFRKRTMISLNLRLDSRFSQSLQPYINEIFTGAMGLVNLSVHGAFLLEDRLFRSKNLSTLTTLSVGHCQLGTTDDSADPPSFSLSSLMLERVTIPESNQHNSGALGLYVTGTLKRLSVAYSSKPATNPSSIILATAPWLEFLRLEYAQAIHHLSPEVLLPFSLCTNLQKLEVDCTSQDLVQIATLLPTHALSFLTLINFVQLSLLHPNYSTVILTAVELPSLSSLEEIWLGDSNRESFARWGLGEWKSTVEKKGIAVKLGVRSDTGTHRS